MTGIGEVIAGLASMMAKVTETSVVVAEVISETEAALDQALTPRAYRAVNR